jgi:hypothetical protein
MKRFRVVAGYENDLVVALRWLHMNKAVVDLGEISKEGEFFVCDILSKMSKKDVASLLNIKFGKFVKLL